MRVVFIGSLTVIIKNKLDIVGIITKKKSTYNSDHFDLTKTIKKKKFQFYTQKILMKKKTFNG